MVRPPAAILCTRTVDGPARTQGRLGETASSKLAPDDVDSMTVRADGCGRGAQDQPQLSRSDEFDSHAPIVGLPAITVL